MLQPARFASAYSCFPQLYITIFELLMTRISTDSYLLLPLSLLGSSPIGEFVFSKKSTCLDTRSAVAYLTWILVSYFTPGQRPEGACKSSYIYISSPASPLATSTDSTWGVLGCAELIFYLFYKPPAFPFRPLWPECLVKAPFVFFG